jgi:hypothetical protein
MAVEPKRLCGYRRVGGIYLCGDGETFKCDRLPMPIEPCPTCGEEVRFSRGIQKINPRAIWEIHNGCACNVNNCPVCYPPDEAFLMWVGSEYTAKTFTDEADDMGVSKRIAIIPNDLKQGSIVYLAMRHIIPNTGKFWLPDMEPNKRNSGPGVFYVFKVDRIEKIITQSMDNAGVGSALQTLGITPVVVPDYDPDHTANSARAKAAQLGEIYEKAMDTNRSPAAAVSV